jgi:heavy metal translocating P-type ATPase
MGSSTSKKVASVKNGRAPEVTAGASSRANGDEHSGSVTWREINRVAFVAAAAAALWFLRGAPNPYITALGVTCTLVGGIPIFHEAYENIRQRRMTMELSMAIAILAALVIREVFTALVITLFVLGAEILEGMTVRRGRRAIQHLVEFLPRTAAVSRGGHFIDIDAVKLRLGDLVLVRPGSRIPVDGAIVAGASFVDQAAITGESLPVEKLPGQSVYAGTVNQSGALEVRATHLGRDTTFGKIIDAVEEAERSRAPIQKTADRLAGYLVYFALGAATITFLITHNARSTISVVIVAGACGIAAGTPLAILGAIGQAARQGSIVKGGLYLEVLAAADTILLDKTGTLTFGAPEVIEVRAVAGVSENTLVEAAAIAESRSEHAIARAILKKAADLRVRLRHPDEFSYTPGKGIVAKIDGEEILVGNWTHIEHGGIQDISAASGMFDGAALVARDGHLLGSIHVADRIRPEAKAAVQALKALGLKTILLTGDSRRVAEDVGRNLSVDEISAELLPEQKFRRVEELLAQGRKVVMVGDGINDAPALMRASVGVAMGSGTDVARESSDIVLIGSDLSTLVETIRIARRCHSIIMQNFVGAILVDSVGVGLAAFGFLNPLLAAFIHVSSELTFILNSARLLVAKPKMKSSIDT